MPDIVFPDAEPRYDAARDLLVFRAVADGRPLQCMISAELLMAEFGAAGPEESQMREAYRAHAEAILALAREHIGNGWIDPEGRVFLSVRRTRLETRFAPMLNGWAEGWKLAHQAHRELLAIIGPASRRVVVEWDLAKDDWQDVVLLRISDPDVPTTASGIFKPDPAMTAVRLQGRLAKVWGEVLSARIREYTLMAG